MCLQEVAPPPLPQYIVAAHSAQRITPDMAISLLYLALAALVSNGNGQPVQHESSSYMYKYQAHSPAVPVMLSVYQAHSPAKPVAHGAYQAQSVPLFMLSGYSAAPHQISSVPHGAFLAETHEEDSAQHAGFSTAKAHSLQGHEHYAGHQEAAAPVVLPSGHLAETREVADARAHHLSAVAQARADEYYGGRAEAGYGGAYGYSGSVHGYGMPVVLPDGHIADTHEVAAAKSAHLVAVAKAKADKYYEGGEGYGYGGAYGYSGSVHGYGVPVVLPSGHIADTHEVAAAKSAHMVAVAHAKAQEALSPHEDEHHEHERPHYEHEEPHYDAHYEHEEPHYDAHYEHGPEYEHDLSHTVHYEPQQQLQYEPYVEPHNAYYP